jgi:cold shock CspA family protein
MDFEDRELPCDTCGGSFVWSAGEQAFFAQRGFSAPRRCTGARKERKAGGGQATYDRCPFGGHAGSSDRPSRTPDRRSAHISRPATPGERLHGRVVRVVAERGFGFIRDEQDQDYYFSDRDLPPGAFSHLTVGAELEFVAAETPRGKRAQAIALRD